MSEHELWNELGNLYFLSGSYGQAIRAYNRAIEMRPDAGEPHSNLALTFMQMGKYPEAMDYYQRSVHLLGDELDKAVSLHKLGDIYLHLKQYAKAAETYQKTEELVSDLGHIVEASNPSDLLLHCPPSAVVSQFGAVNEGASLAGSIDAGLPPFVEELAPWQFDDQVEPEHGPEPDYDFWYVDELGVHSSSEGIVSTEPLTWEPGEPCQTRPAEHDQVVENVIDGGTVDIPDDQVAMDAGLVESMNESITQELEDSDALVDEPASVPIMVITNGPEIVTESLEFSTEDITNPEAVQYSTSDEWPMVELSQAERHAIQVDINKFNRLLEINPNNAFAWDTLGGNYKALGQYDEAIRAYQKAVSLDSTKAFYFHHLGLVYAAVGRHDDAINTFERVIEVDPEHSLAHATLGGYYRKNGNEKLAMEHIEKARSLLANDENEYNRACMEAICGNMDQSLELLELALKSRQTYVNWARKDPDLDFVRSDPRFRALLAEYAAKPA